MDQAVGAREDLDERAEVGDPLHLAEVDAVELGLLGELVDHRPRRARARRGSGEKIVTMPVVLDVDLGARGVLDAADHLAAGADHVADPVGLDRDHLHARRIARELRARPEVDELAGVSCSMRSRMWSRPSRACSSARSITFQSTLRILMSICSAVMPVRVPGDLEVHVAEVVLVAEDVGEDRDAVALLDQAHRDARDRRRAAARPRPSATSVAAADRRHRRRAVRLEHLGHDADRVREALELGQHLPRARARRGCRGPTSRRPGPRSMRASPTENGGKL